MLKGESLAKMWPSEPAYLELGIGDAAQAQGFRVLLQSVENVAQPDAYTHLVGEKQIDGIILSGPRSDDS